MKELERKFGQIITSLLLLVVVRGRKWITSYWLTFLVREQFFLEVRE